MHVFWWWMHGVCSMKYDNKLSWRMLNLQMKKINWGQISRLVNLAWGKFWVYVKNVYSTLHSWYFTSCKQFCGTWIWSKPTTHVTDSKTRITPMFQCMICFDGLYMVFGAILSCVTPLICEWLKKNWLGMWHWIG
jgi:hypothetical protein